MRKLCSFFVIGHLLAAAAIVDSSAQDYPAKPLRMVVGYSAGGATDVTARIVAQKLSENLGRPVVIENRPGAGSSLATERVAKSPPDGYTLLMMTSSDAIQPALRTKLPYDLERDLIPVSFVAVGPLVLTVHPSVPARNAEQLIALARTRAGKLTYGSPGVGTSQHLAGELFKAMAKVDILHVPYKGGAENASAAAGGHVDASFGSLLAALPLLKADKLRALAVTSAKRASLIPSVPTLGESAVPGYERSGWFAVSVPAGVPKEIIARLNTAIEKTVHSAEIRESFKSQGLEPQTSTSEQLAAFIRSEVAQSARLIKLAGVSRE